MKSRRPWWQRRPLAPGDRVRVRVADLVLSPNTGTVVKRFWLLPGQRNHHGVASAHGGAYVVVRWDDEPRKARVCMRHVLQKVSEARGS